MALGGARPTEFFWSVDAEQADGLEVGAEIDLDRVAVEHGGHDGDWRIEGRFGEWG